MFPLFENRVMKINIKHTLTKGEGSVNVKEVAKITGLSVGRIKTSIRRGRLNAEFFDDGSGRYVYRVSADDVYEYARNIWFSGLAPMYGPSIIARDLLRKHGGELSEQTRKRLDVMQYETDPERETVATERAKRRRDFAEKAKAIDADSTPRSVLHGASESEGGKCRG